MEETTIGSEIIDTNQHFIYEYDFVKSWSFLIQLIQVVKNADADMTLEYPLVSRIEGVGPMQYGTKGLLGEKFADIEEKYDLNEAAEGFGEEGLMLVTMLKTAMKKKMRMHLMTGVMMTAKMTTSRIMSLVLDFSKEKLFSSMISILFISNLN
jgi:hypothetical protein